MALSAPSTPRNNYTPRRNLNQENRDTLNFLHPVTPRSQLTTPKRLPKTPLSETPDCFSNVTVETPGSAYKRRSSKDNKYDEISNLTVAVRIRPMNARELAIMGTNDVVQVKGQDLIIRSNNVSHSTMSVDHIFQYDHIFWSCDETNKLYTTQEDVFLTLGQPLLNSAFRGYNACLFAYGQTGSGKSFSMMGRNTCEVVDIDSEDYSGITPRFCRELFNRINSLPNGSSASVEVSYFEIYNEKIHDLLSSQTSASKTPLKVREHPVWGPYVVDLSVHTVKCYKELRNWLLIGNKNRATAATNMNEKSSRSHSIFSIELCLSEGLNDGDSSRRSKVSLIDLAGSERLGNSHSHNTEEKIRQGVSINKSLLTLGKVISSLADQKRNHFIPYRDSVLTWLLRESLGGNSLTSMLATITPSSTNIDETLATLRYACQARSIVNRARINENPHDKLIRELRSEVERLRALRQDYERTSIGSSSSTILHLSDISNCEELEDLRHKLSETELQLQEAQLKWEQKLIETKEKQLVELAEADKKRAELESKVRVMRTSDKEVNLSPYRTNFLQQLESVLEKEQKQNQNNLDNFESIRTWCLKNSLHCSSPSPNTLKIIDYENKSQTVITLSDLANFTHSIEPFLERLNWTPYRSNKKLTKSDIVNNMNQIHEALANLLPSGSEDNLSLLYAKVNKSLQGFETALLNSVGKNGPKSVTFNMNLDVDS